MTLGEWLLQAEARLRVAGIESTRLEAQVLAAHVLLVDRSWLFAHADAEFPVLAGESLLQRRERHEPLAYILGKREFYGREFFVRPGVLIPRQDTEVLVETALAVLDELSRSGPRPPFRCEPSPGAAPEHRREPKLDSAVARDVAAGPRPPFGDEPSPGAPHEHRREPKLDSAVAEDVAAGPRPPFRCDVLDIGVGSGAIAITLKLERPWSTVTGVDISDLAIEIASQNADRLGADIGLLLSDGFQELAADQFDLIVSNPPYIGLSEQLSIEVSSHEPSVALFSGPTGLEFYERLAREAPPHLRRGGRLLLEVGHTQATEVRRLFETQGWTWRQTVRDLSGIERVVEFEPE